MKQTLIVILTACMVFLVGCGKQSSTEGKQDKGSAQASTIAPQKTNAPAADEYRDLKREDGINFGAYVDKMAFSFGGAPSGTLTKFGLVDADGKFYELELDSKEFSNGEIKTKHLGVVRAQSSGATSMSYALTESQIKKARAYLAEQKGK
jgi:hypothetical protein